MNGFGSTTFDSGLGNFGLFPPGPADPLIGLFNEQNPLGGDINANGQPDKVLTNLGVFSFPSVTSTIVLPNGDVVSNLSLGAFIQGQVLDVISDPPFIIGGQLPNGLPDPAAFGGTGSTTSSLLNTVVPEPSAAVLLLLALAGALRRKR